MEVKRYADKVITEEESKDVETYKEAGWDFEEVWAMDNDGNLMFKHELDSDEDEDEDEDDSYKDDYKEMYHAMVNSPLTELSEAINDEQEEIKVKDGDALPSAPNLAVIGDENSLETILYTSKDGNTLEVQRGIEGNVKSWNKGSLVSRNFTAYDHNAFKENIDMLIEEVGRLNNK